MDQCASLQQEYAELLLGDSLINLKLIYKSNTILGKSILSDKEYQLWGQVGGNHKPSVIKTLQTQIRMGINNMIISAFQISKDKK